jgi:hypothetical protein
MPNIQLQATIQHPLGTFTGYLEVTGDPTLEEARGIADGLMQSINGLKSLVIKRYDGSEVCFNQHVLQQSILTLRVVESPSTEVLE